MPVPVMVERVARSIAANKRKLDPNEPEIDRVWNAYCGQARAAIAALMEPTGAMRRAASRAMSPGRRPIKEYVSNEKKHAIRYQAMLRVALSHLGDGFVWQDAESAHEWHVEARA